MSKRVLLKRAALLIISGLTVLAIYEAYRVSKALSVVDAKFESILSEATIKASVLTPAQKRILLTVEDPGFETHKGIDFKTPGGGMTTLTQALTKRVFFEDFKPGFAKIEQSLIARYVVHKHVSKEDQITSFLNLVYLGRCEGEQMQGYPAAAQCYLDKSFDELTDKDFINLTARLMAPNKYNRNEKALAQRVAKIENLLSGECEPTGWRDVNLETC